MGRNKKNKWNKKDIWFFLSGIIKAAEIKEPAFFAVNDICSISVSFHSASSPESILVSSLGTARATLWPWVGKFGFRTHTAVVGFFRSWGFELNGAGGVGSFVGIRELFALIKKFLTFGGVSFFSGCHFSFLNLVVLKHFVFAKSIWVASKMNFNRHQQLETNKYTRQKEEFSFFFR